VHVADMEKVRAPQDFRLTVTERPKGVLGKTELTAIRWHWLPIAAVWLSSSIEHLRIQRSNVSCEGN